MKKLIAVACVAALALACIVGCSSTGSSSSSSSTASSSSSSSSSSAATTLKYAGEWQIDSVQVGNISADVSSVFTSFSLKLNKDSSYDFSYELQSGEKTVSTSGSPWEATSTGVSFGSGEDEVNLTADGDKLVLNVTDVIKVNLVKK